MALSGLQDSPVGLRECQIVALEGAAVELDPALIDHPAPVAGRLPQAAREKGRQVDGIFGDGNVVDLVRSLVFAHDASEVLLPSTRALFAVPAPDDSTRE